MRVQTAVTVVAVVCLCCLALPSSPAWAGVTCHSEVYNTGNAVGTGSTCSDAKSNLLSNLYSYAFNFCDNLYPNNFATFCNYHETDGACTANGSGWKITGSASFHCSTCAGLGC